jgi:hypothetical protein
VAYSESVVVGERKPGMAGRGRPPQNSRSIINGRRAKSMPPCELQKSHGAAMCASRDILATSGLRIAVALGV